MLQEFKVLPNKCLTQEIKSFYHTYYLGYQRPNNPDYLNTLKNTYNSCTQENLESAAQELVKVLLEDFPIIIRKLGTQSITVCVVPRAKAENSYKPNQLLFKKVVQNVCDRLSINDGTDYIIRHTNTKTTHLPRNIRNYNNDGDSPFSGITINTCGISDNVRGKEILLVDDIYTNSINIDEDAIQALLDSGAKSVFFFAIAYTVFKNFNN